MSVLRYFGNINLNEVQIELRQRPSLKLWIMKRLITGVLAIAILASPATAVAQPTLNKNALTSLIELKVIAAEPAVLTVAKEVKQAPEPPKPVAVVYLVVEGDNLTKIGTANKVEWQRLWAKNTELKHPDRIYVGDKITIPLPDEVLARELPAVVSLPVVTPGVIPAPAGTAKPQAPAPRGASSGNTYSAGYCTWYTKNKRPDLPNSLGNANTWFARAQALGLPTGTEPRAGAIGTTTRGALGHTVYVESVNANGTVNISEMNYKGWNITSYRTTSAGEFQYIY